MKKGKKILIKLPDKIPLIVGEFYSWDELKIVLETDRQKQDALKNKKLKPKTKQKLEKKKIKKISNKKLLTKNKKKNLLTKKQK